MRMTHGAHSAEYGQALANLGAIYNDWADQPGQVARSAQAQSYNIEALNITRAVRGDRHPQTATLRNNLALVKAKMNDWKNAATEAERALATLLSLGLFQHQKTALTAAHLAHILEQAGESNRAARLQRGDISDLLPVIAQVEADHRAWVAKDPKNRRFGPPSAVGSSSQDGSSKVANGLSERKERKPFASLKLQGSADLDESILPETPPPSQTKSYNNDSRMPRPDRPISIRVFALSVWLGITGFAVWVAGLLLDHFMTMYVGAGLVALGLSMTTLTLIDAEETDEWRSV